MERARRKHSAEGKSDFCRHQQSLRSQGWRQRPAAQTHADRTPCASPRFALATLSGAEEHRRPSGRGAAPRREPAPFSLTQPTTGNTALTTESIKNNVFAAEK